MVTRNTCENNVQRFQETFEKCRDNIRIWNLKRGDKNKVANDFVNLITGKPD